MEPITVSTIVNAPIDKVWEYWTKPEHITHWNFASDDWCAPRAENDLRLNGKFNYRMEAKDGSMGFDMIGTYTSIEQPTKIEYMFDTRKVRVEFLPDGNGCKVMETFDPENINSREMQEQGWQAILENFKKYVEAN